ncbi:hypothetical protein P5V15_007133 [Pogonomyrmex californicus]
MTASYAVVRTKTTLAQVDYMIDYLVQYPHATGKFKSLHDNADLRGSWQLVKELNRQNMAKDGKIKDVKSWKAQKFEPVKLQQETLVVLLKLTEREQKILGIMGFDYIEGVQCPDAFPEKQPEAMELLHQGQEDILEVVPITITIQNSNDSRERLSTQLLNAREDFAIAKRQIMCMEMFAKIMKKITDNDQERNAILCSLIENEKAREKTYLDLTLIIKDCVEVLKEK